VSKREALVEAAKSLLWERGFHAMSPRDVLRRSRAGQGSLYHFFSGKEDLAAEAMSAVAEEVSQRIELVCGRGTGSGIERIQRYLLSDRDALRGCRLGRMAQDPDLPASLRTSVAGAFERLRSVLEAAVQDAQREGALHPSLDASATAECIIAVVQGGYVLARAHGESEDMARITGVMSSLLLLLQPPQNEPAVPRPRPGSGKRSAKRKNGEHDGKPKSRVRKAT
jgi:TetR/AcrR family transcriptional repressor of nem operon